MVSRRPDKIGKETERKRKRVRPGSGKDSRQSGRNRQVTWKEKGTETMEQTIMFCNVLLQKKKLEWISIKF